MRLWGRDINHQVRQLQHTSQCNHRDIARNVKILPGSCETFVSLLKATVKSERESLSFGTTHISKNQNGSQTEPNQFPYQMNISCHSLLSSNSQHRESDRTPRNLLQFCIHNKNTLLRETTVFPCLAFTCTRFSKM